MTSNRPHDQEEAPDRRRLHKLFGVAGVLAVPLLIIWWPGCRQYPAVTSKEALQQMRLLYSACNTQDMARLTRVEQGVARLTSQGKLTEAEQGAFQKIIDLAKDGDWQTAERAAFKFAQDQVGQGDSTPEPYDDHANHKHPPKGKLRR